MDCSSSANTPLLLPRCCPHKYNAAPGAESSDELSDIHLDSDAVLLAVEDPTRPATADGAAEGARGAGVAVVLAFRLVKAVESS